LSKIESQYISGTPTREQVNDLISHYQNGTLIAAEKLAGVLTREFPSNNLTWKVLGEVLSATGRKSEALEANQTAIMIAPHDAAAHVNLGITLSELERLDEAEASYSQAIKLKSDFPEAYNNLSTTLKELGRLEDADAGFRQAIALTLTVPKPMSTWPICLKDWEG